VTLVELLVVVAILGILGGVTGLFLIKYLPEHHLRSAASTLSQDLRQAQVGAIRRLETWSVTMNTATQSYSIEGPIGTVVKTVNLSSYDGEIRFTAVSGSPIQFSEEGFSTSGNATMRNSRGSLLTIQVLRTGVVRVQ
jgi:prepilin-type N-terminal cleavage/methylation domain-containing protein